MLDHVGAYDIFGIMWTRIAHRPRKRNRVTRRRCGRRTSANPSCSAYSATRPLVDRSVQKALTFPRCSSLRPCAAGEMIFGRNKRGPAVFCASAYLVGAVEFLIQISAIRAEIPFGPGHRSQRAVTDFSSGESRSEGWQRLLLQSGERRNARHCLDGKTAEHRKPGMVFVSAN